MKNRLTLRRGLVHHRPMKSQSIADTVTADPNKRGVAAADIAYIGRPNVVELETPNKNKYVPVVMHKHLSAFTAPFEGTDRPIQSHPSLALLHYMHLVVAIGFYVCLLRGLQQYECVYVFVYKWYAIGAAVFGGVMCVQQLASVVTDDMRMTAACVCSTVVQAFDALTMVWLVTVLVDTYQYFRMCKTMIEMGNK